MKPRFSFFLPLFVFAVMGPGSALAQNSSGTSTNLKLVGHNDLFSRGMNSAATIYKNFIYVGNRTDGSTSCGLDLQGNPIPGVCPHRHPGVLILDIKNPANPSVVGEIGPPFAGVPGITTRELRVWPEKKLLMIMTFHCSSFLHACIPGATPFEIKFFDLKDPRNPRFLTSYVPTSKAVLQVEPHEMFLWADPENEDRALLYLSTPNIFPDPTIPNLVVVDISAVSRGGSVSEVAEGNWVGLYPGTNQANYPFDPNSLTGCGPYDCNLFVHSMSVSPNGKRTYMSLEAGHFLILDTSAVAKNASPGQVISLNNSLITNPMNRAVWLQTPADPSAVPFNCFKNCPNAHSAVKVPGRPLVVTIDEVYGTFTDPSFGCPWGWQRLIDISDPTHPVIVGEYKIAQNEQSFCGSPADDPLTEGFTSFSTHNPTVLRKLVIDDWHSGGVQVSDISDPSHPTSAGVFSPKPLPSVAIEDPALGRGPTKVIMWSYPIIKDGLIYVIDIRNGLYILRYSGPHSDEVGDTEFLEGNSNIGNNHDSEEK